MLVRAGGCRSPPPSSAITAAERRGESGSSSGWRRRFRFRSTAHPPTDKEHDPASLKFQSAARRRSPQPIGLSMRRPSTGAIEMPTLGQGILRYRRFFYNRLSWEDPGLPIICDAVCDRSFVLVPSGGTVQLVNSRYGAPSLAASPE